MGYLIAAKLGRAVLTLVLLSVLIFVLSRAVGNPVDLLLPADALPDARRQLTEALDLDRPLVEQYARYLGQIVHGDLGRSIRGGEPVIDLLAQRLPASLALAGAAMLFAIALSFPMGIVAALYRGQKIDSIMKFVALLGQSTPPFWIGILLIQLFAVQLGWLPASGSASVAAYVMPAFTMSLFVLAGMSRLLRTQMLEVLDADYIRFARSKGVPEARIVWKHALRNAVLPVISFGGVYFSILVTMGIVIEVVFAWPGIGRLAFNAIAARDYPVMQGVILATGAIVVIVNATIDVIYAVVDPRVRYS